MLILFGRLDKFYTNPRTVYPTNSSQQDIQWIGLIRQKNPSLHIIADSKRVHTLDQTAGRGDVNYSSFAEEALPANRTLQEIATRGPYRVTIREAFYLVGLCEHFPTNFFKSHPYKRVEEQGMGCGNVSLFDDLSVSRLR